MHCAHCGKEIGDKHKCSCCGAAQHSDDLFAVLGDLGPNTNDGRMESVVNEPIASITYGDYFSELGDIPANEDCSPIMQADNTASENVSSTDPFHVLGNLDGSPYLLDDTGMDAPATGGFKPMDELVPSNDGQEETEETENRNPTVTFVWKKWMTIAACCTTIICLLLFVVCSGSLQFTNGKYSTESAENVLEQVLEAPNLEVDTEGIETPAFLYSIESRNGYEILSFEKTQAGAVATMRVFAPDVYGVAKNLDSINTYTDANTLMDALDSALKTAPIVEKQVVVEYILTDEGYAPILTVEFLDAYYGGIYQLRDEVIANAAVEG